MRFLSCNCAVFFLKTVSIPELKIQLFFEQFCCNDKDWEQTSQAWCLIA